MGAVGWMREEWVKAQTSEGKVMARVLWESEGFLLVEFLKIGRVQTERDGTRAETRFGLPAKRTSSFISAGVSVQSSTGFLGVRVSGERL